MEFDDFLRKNHIKKGEIAIYLGVSNAFITQLCSGARGIPQDKLAIIKANEEGWDTSMFDSPVIQTIGDGSSNNTQVAGRSSLDAERLLKLLEKKDEQIDRLLKVIETLNAK